jgi:aspartate aminotransferase-like enzyme/N-acyl-L-homoserine lactone synthetase
MNAAASTVIDAADIIFKIATEPWEFEAIHRLNYRTFVEEIPQHAANADKRLVDRFHAENRYCIGIRDQRLLAMVCLRTQRPFSLDQKLDNLAHYLPHGKRICEIRLLAVEQEVRHGRTTLALFQFLARYALSEGFDLGIMSGTTRQLRLYRRIGFVPFGPLVGEGEATYQPMMLSLSNFLNQTLPRLNMNVPTDVVNFMPGPVGTTAAVRNAMGAAPTSHRDAAFSASLTTVSHALCGLTQAKHVAVLLGSGTLANDMIAGQLLCLNARGLIVSNGEFSERLCDHARRMQLDFQHESLAWGEAITLEKLAHWLNADIKWLWLAHCETSTGVMIDLDAVVTLCQARRVRLCVDGISSIGVVDVDLSNVYLASAVSGKGLASYPGLSMVFYNEPVISGSHAPPRYLDLSLHTTSTPFTHSSNLVDALAASLATTDWPNKFLRIAEDGHFLKVSLLAGGHHVVAANTVTSPAVTTIAVPAPFRSIDIGESLAQLGFLTSYRSAYLQQRNWLQICLMGTYLRDDLARLLAALRVATLTNIGATKTR